MEVKFKIADISHIEGIIDLCNSCFEEKTTLEEARKLFEKWARDPNQIYLIGECENKVIAHTRIAIVPTIFSGMDTFAILNHVCVKPEFRKHHIGTKMLEVTKYICQKRGCTSIKLWSKNFRIPAHACYQKFGFLKEDATFFSIKI